MKFDKSFLLGCATAAHQVEGNNVNSDFWTMEQLPHSTFKEKSLDAVDHYHRYPEDLDLMKDAGLNGYRFTIEWARIEPMNGYFNEDEIKHYIAMIEACKAKGIEPIVTLHHFTSPKWLIQEGGWESERTIFYFERYVSAIIKRIGHLVNYVCTINEANMGLQINRIMKERMSPKDGDVQVGINTDFMKNMQLYMTELGQAFGIDPRRVQTFLSSRTTEGDRIIIRAHQKAKSIIKQFFPHIKVGITLSLHDFQMIDNHPDTIKHHHQLWDEEFLHYMPFIKDDDFIGVQNYSRKLVGENGVVKAPIDSELTNMGYEFYPEGISNVIRSVNQVFKGPIIVTENGVDTDKDERRIVFIDKALLGVKRCIDDGIPVLGYMYWSLLDNFEWMLGYKPTFGVIAVDRKTQKRYPKLSLKFLGSFSSK